MKQFGLICLIFTVILSAPVIQNVSAERIGIEPWRLYPENAGVNITDDGTYILVSDIYDDILITKSNMTFNGNGYSIRGDLSLSGASNVTLINHNFTGTSENELYIRDSNQIHVLDSTFYLTYIGIQDSSHIEISRNKIDTWAYSISSHTSEHVTITNNQISSTNDGLFLSYCNYFTITENTFSKHQQFRGNTCINLQESHNNTIFDNDFQDFHYGLYLWSSSTNLIYENRFNDVPEKTVSVEESSGNQWDYQNKGNYYFDYLYHYPDATPIGGIMDTPYVHDDDNIDYYPLKVEGSTPQPTEKIPTSIDLSGNIQVQSVDDSSDIESMSLKGKIEPALDSVLITINKEDPNHDIWSETVTTDENGKFSVVIYTSGYGDYTIDVIFDGDDKYKASSSRIIYSVEQIQKSMCIIATATYGSELTPEVQFLRGFRDNTVYSTYAGSNFMTIFNEFYYSFSPQVAQVIAGNEALRGVMKIVLYPLLGILHLSYNTFTLFRFIPELAIVLAGLVSSSLIGLVYFTPGVLLFYYTKKIKPSVKITRTLTITWMGTILIMVLGGVTSSSPLMMASTALFVLGTIASTTIIITKKALTYTP